MAKTKHPTVKEMLGPLPPLRRRRAPTPDEIQLDTLRNYLATHFPDAIVTHGQVHGYETTATRTVELLDKLRDYERRKKEDEQYATSALDRARANAVKGAVARLIGGHQKLSTEELKKQAIEMIADEKFWRDLSTIAWSQEEMKKALGPYAY